MKILHVVDSLGLGGAQTLIRGIFEFQKENEDISLFALRKRSPMIPIEHSRIQVHDSYSRYSLKPLFALKDFIEKENIEILHCHLFRSQVFGYLLKRIWFKDITLIFHEHSGIIEDGYLYNLFMSFAQKHVDLFIACSRAMEDALMVNAKITRDKIQVLHNFVDIEKFSRSRVTWNVLEERARVGITDADFVVGFAGRLVERKGWRDFLKAAQRFSDNGINIKFLIAGDGPDRQEFLKMISDSSFLSERVLYLGYIKDMLKFYSLLDCFVMPSHWEGLSMVQLEVMALGTPLVISNGPGMNEVAQEGVSCLYVKVGDDGDIYEKISLLLKNVALRDKMGLESQKVAQAFSLKSYLEKLEQVYLSIL